MKNSRLLRGLTSPRAAVLDALLEQPDPVGVQALSVRLGRHHNTVREQLNWLIARGWVLRHRVPGPGRGRPSWRYQALGPTPAPEAHAEMAAELAWAMSEEGRESDTVSARARGRQWGLDRAGARRSTAHEARAATVAVLDELGFRPTNDADATASLLTRCPLLQAAHQFPDVVCSMHEGLVVGLLEGHGTTCTEVTLVPFGHPDGCPLTLR